MNIFILEDDEIRLRYMNDLILTRYPEALIFTSDRVDLAKEILVAHQPFKCIFLDHDLGHQVYVDSNESNTGYQLAKFIRDSGIKTDEIIVHSFNEVGSDNIMSILKGAKRIRYDYLQEYFNSLND